MKKLAITFLMLLGVMATQIEAKTIHWLTFFDTTDGVGEVQPPEVSIGEIDQNTRKILYSRWIDLVNATLKEEGYNVNTIDIYGSKTSPEKCKDIINDLDCDSEDIIVFYYVGHGTENTSTSKYPLMCMAQHDINKFIPLSWVHNTLKKKNARMTITIGMCCNSRQGIPGRTNPTFSANYGVSYVDNNMAAAIKKMFLNFKGDLLVASASPNESSYPCDSSLGYTDFFTFNVIKQFNTVLPNKDNPNWEDMLSNIRDDVYEEVMSDIGKKQTATWENNLVDSKTPHKTKPTPPNITASTTSPNDDRTILKTELDRVLSFISSTNVDRQQRVSAIEKIKPVFTDDMNVRIMSQDGNVVVDREDISTFLGRIATSRLLKNVSVVDFNINQSGQISSLRVREVYKK